MKCKNKFSFTFFFAFYARMNELYRFNPHVEQFALQNVQFLQH